LLMRTNELLSTMELELDSQNVNWPCTQREMRMEKRYANKRPPSSVGDLTTCQNY